MEWNRRVIKALLELAVTLGIEPLSTERQLLFLRALAKWSAEDLEFACARAAEETSFPRMPLPGELIGYARQAPRSELQVDLSRRALSETTSYNDKLADEAIRKVMSLFPDDFDCKALPVVKSASMAEQKAALMTLFGENEAHTIREVFENNRMRQQDQKKL